MQGVNLRAGCSCLRKAQRRTEGPRAGHLQLWNYFIASKTQPWLGYRWRRKSTSPFCWESYVSPFRTSSFRSVVINVCGLYRRSRWLLRRAGREGEFLGELWKFPRYVGHVVKWVCELWLRSLQWVLLGWMASGYSLYQIRQHNRK